MKNQDHIDKIIHKILTSRKLEPAMISALAQVITALSGVKEFSQEPNNIKSDGDLEQMFAPTEIDIKNLKEVSINGRTHPINIS